jgi:PAS domain S-box-containing protein
MLPVIHGCLIVDDDEGICELIRDSLQSEGITVRVAHTGAAALDALNEHGPMLVLLDLQLPDTDGREIAAILRQREPRVPFIIISGLADTQVAIDMMKQGAVDFLIKDIAFLNLVPGVVKRALVEQERERKLLEAEQALQQSDERFRQIAGNIRDVFYMVSASDHGVLYASPAYEEIWGRSIEALRSNADEWMQAILEEDRVDLQKAASPLFQGAAMVQTQYRIRRPDGTIRWIEDRFFPVFDDAGSLYRIAGLATDVTERKRLEQEILNISERERRRIGHDLHDDLCQRLAATKLKCEMLADTLEKRNLPNASLASEISRQIAEATALSRSIARGLSPVDLEVEGLMAALGKLASSAEAIHEVPCFFVCPQPVMVGNATTAAHIYRIAQELVNNAARHANPGQIDLRLTHEADCVRLEVHNDGIPFNEASETGTGMGLKIIRYRAAAINGTVQFQSDVNEPGSGTKAVCLVPDSSCSLAEPIPL